MKSLNITPCGRTKSLLIALHALNNDSTAAVSMVMGERDSDVTPYMFSNAIVACGDDWRLALTVLKRAGTLNKADEAVFTAAARCCVWGGEYVKGFKIIDAMLKRGLPFNKYSFSFVVNTCLLHQINGNDGISYLTKYLTMVKEDYPYLLTNAVCQKVMKDLVLCRQASLAATFHLNVFAHNTCKSDTLGLLLRDLQIISEELHNDKIKIILDNNNNNNNNNNLENNNKKKISQNFIKKEKIDQSYDIEIIFDSKNYENNKIENIVTMNNKNNKQNNDSNIKIDAENEANDIGEIGEEEVENELEKEEVEEVVIDSARERELEIENKIKVMAERGLALIALYCSTTTPNVRSVSTDDRTYGTDRTLSRRHLLRISHFNRYDKQTNKQ